MDTDRAFEVAFADLREKFGGLAIDFATAAKEVGYRTAGAAYTARARGQFPLRTVGRGAHLRVMVAELARFAVTGEPAGAEAQAPRVRRPGRPTKADQIRRRAAQAE